MKQRESKVKTIHMNNVKAGKRTVWNMAHFVADTITSYATLDSISNDWRRQKRHMARQKHTCMFAYTPTHLSAGLLMFSCEIIETSCEGIDLSLQREPQGLMVLFRD